MASSNILPANSPHQREPSFRMYSFSNGLALASCLQLFDGAKRPRHPLRRGELVPAQKASFEVLAREAGHPQKGLIGVRDATASIEKNHADGLDLGNAPEPLLAIAQPRFAVAQVLCDAADGPPLRQ